MALILRRDRLRHDFFLRSSLDIIRTFRILAKKKKKKVFG